MPALLQNRWLLLVCLAGLALLGWLANAWRMRQLAKSFELVLKERERMAREMHDTLIQGCTGISALLEAIVMRRGGVQDADSELLEHARTETRRMIDEARRAVWDLREGSRVPVDLIPALRELTAKNAAESGRAVRLETNIKQLNVPAHSATEIVMTVREAVLNALKHSGSSTVTVVVANSARELVVQVRDVGCGLEAATEADGHYGIVGMQERMRRIGGGLEIACAPGLGTTVWMRLQWESMLQREVLA